MGKNLVSILIPVYNREELVKRAIESAINQTYENIEVIAVDNKSTDRTYEVLKEYAEKYPDVKVYQNEENLGPVGNWQKCLEYSSGDYIKILFSDDWIDETFVEKCMEILLAHEDVGFVFTPAYEIDIETGDKVTLWHKVFEEKKVLDTKVFIEGTLLQDGYPNSPCCALFRRMYFSESLLIQVPNKWNIDHSKTGAGNDLLIFLIMAKKYDKFGFIPEPLVYFGSDKKLGITKNMDSSLWLRSYWSAKLFFADTHCNQKLRKKVNKRFYITGINLKLKKLFRIGGDEG